MPVVGDSEIGHLQELASQDQLRLELSRQQAFAFEVTTTSPQHFHSLLVQLNARSQMERESGLPTLECQSLNNDAYGHAIHTSFTREMAPHRMPSWLLSLPLMYFGTIWNTRQLVVIALNSFTPKLHKVGALNTFVTRRYCRGQRI